MTKPMVRIHNISTDTITDREMTDEEFAQYEADQAAEAARVAAKAAEAIAKAALLTQLGITEEQAKLLLS
jgi:uncharacterized protein (DUF2384 family)